MIDCPSPVSETAARQILATYPGNPELAREPRFWLSKQRIAALNEPEDRRDLLQLKARIEMELRD